MLSVDWYVRNRIKHVHPVSDGNSRCRLGAARHSTTSRVLPAQSASRVTVRHGMNVPDSLFLTYLGVPYGGPAVPYLFASGTIESPKNFITVMVIRHTVDVYVFVSNQSACYGCLGLSRSRPGDLT